MKKDRIMTTCANLADEGRIIIHLNELKEELEKIQQMLSFSILVENKEIPRIEIESSIIRGKIILLTSLILKDDKIISELNRFIDGNNVVFMSGSVSPEFEYILSHDLIFQFLPHRPTAGQFFTSLRNAFEILKLRHTILDKSQRTNKLRSQLNIFADVASALNAEHDVDKLLEIILLKCREVTNSDAGSIYIVERDRNGELILKFKNAQNDSKEIDVAEFSMPVTRNSIAGATVLKRSFINIPDAYNPPEELNIKHNPDIDIKLGYITKSMLVIPLINNKDTTIGVVQLINKKIDKNLPLLSEADFINNVTAYNNNDEQILLFLGAQAGIALDNAMLYEEIVRIFEGMVQASVHAIEQRDPPTSGHTQRVSLLSVALAKELNNIDEGKFKDEFFDDLRIKKIKYAALLHDIGKIGVREHILLKPKKLPEGWLEIINERLDKIKCNLECPKNTAKDEIDISKYRELIKQANEPMPLKPETKGLLNEMKDKKFFDINGQEIRIINEEEYKYLTIESGSLTKDERQQIESHALYSFQFLSEIPWGKGMEDLPKIASAHHEKMNGSGYPWKLKADEIPIESKIIGIADFFDALCSPDRPYKKPLSIQKTIEIIRLRGEAGEIDMELFNIFVEKQIYKVIDYENQK